MANRKASFYTLGCKLNQYDTEVLKEAFRADGFQIVPFGEKADVCIVNTCAVTIKSDYQSRQALRRAIRSSPEAIVAAIGCYAQVVPSDLAAIPGVDLVVGINGRHHLLELVKSCPGNPQIIVDPIPSDWQEEDISCFDNHTRAFVKIQEGCNYKCAYCIVPTARGPSRSRAFADVIHQAQKLVECGYKELVLTGTHLGAYGEDLHEKKGLIDVMESLETMSGLGRFRISSIEPTEISDAMISFFTRSSKFCRHLHIPLQSAADDVLKAMGRPYTVDDYLALLRRLAEHIPGIRLGADVMVGFPGESAQHFEHTYQTIEQSPLNYLHVFHYSARPSTRAAYMAEQVNPKIKKERSARLRALGEQKARAFHASFLGKTLNVLFENRRDKTTGLLTGLTDNYIRVLCKGPDSLMDTLSDTRIERLGDGYVAGLWSKRLTCGSSLLFGPVGRKL